MLRDRGAELTAELCRQAVEDDDPALLFDAKVYGAAEVKQALIEAQHDKCCFCESKIGHVAFGDVEHFRPKAGVRQSPDDSERRPGYYWLAYEWSNLYLACEPCNRRHKRNLFPLENDADRSRSHLEAERLNEERPLFIDPGADEPTELIGFRRAFPFAIGGSARATATIESLALRRRLLQERRSEHRKTLLAALLSIRNWLALGCPESQRRLVEGIAANVLAYLGDDAEYAAMSRAVLRDALPWRSIEPSMPASDFLAELEQDAEHGRWLAIPPH
ncbi:MAG: hypothetical protein AB1Z98_14820 [Nannocystaceae bacterium]